MRKTISILAIVFLAVFALWAKDTVNFLSAAININATVTAVIVTDFADHKVDLGSKEEATMTCTFTRAAGSASTVNYTIQGSYDSGTTWVPYYVFQVATNTTAVSGNIVRYLFNVNLPRGYTHLRCYSIENSDAANNITAVNIAISFK